MVPFHAVPAMEPLASVNTTSKEVMGLANAVLEIRTAAGKPPCHGALVVRTSTVTPPPDAATAAVPLRGSALVWLELPQAARATPIAMMPRRGPVPRTFREKFLVMKTPLGGHGEEWTVRTFKRADQPKNLPAAATRPVARRQP